jgi:hypothetical protein
VPKKEYRLGNFISPGILGDHLSLDWRSPGYILEYPQAFIANPISIFSINQPYSMGGQGQPAPDFRGVVWSTAKLDFWLTLDLLAPAFATLSLFIGVAHFASEVRLR